METMAKSIGCLNLVVSHSIPTGYRIAVRVPSSIQELVKRRLSLSSKLTHLSLEWTRKAPKRTPCSQSSTSMESYARLCPSACPASASICCRTLRIWSLRTGSFTRVEILMVSRRACKCSPTRTSEMRIWTLSCSLWPSKINQQSAAYSRKPSSQIHLFLLVSFSTRTRAVKSTS